MHLFVRWSLLLLLFMWCLVLLVFWRFRWFFRRMMRRLFLFSLSKQLSALLLSVLVHRLRLRWLSLRLWLRHRFGRSLFLSRLAAFLSWLVHFSPRLLNELLNIVFLLFLLLQLPLSVHLSPLLGFHFLDAILQYLLLLFDQLLLDPLNFLSLLPDFFHGLFHFLLLLSYWRFFTASCITILLGGNIANAVFLSLVLGCKDILLFLIVGVVDTWVLRTSTTGACRILHMSFRVVNTRCCLMVRVSNSWATILFFDLLIGSMPLDSTLEFSLSFFVLSRLFRIQRCVKRWFRCWLWWWSDGWIWLHWIRVNSCLTWLTGYLFTPQFLFGVGISLLIRANFDCLITFLWRSMRLAHIEARHRSWGWWLRDASTSAVILRCILILFLVTTYFSILRFCCIWRFRGISIFGGI